MLAGIASFYIVPPSTRETKNGCCESSRSQSGSRDDLYVADSGACREGAREGFHAPDLRKIRERAGVGSHATGCPEREHGGEQVAPGHKIPPLTLKS